MYIDNFEDYSTKIYTRAELLEMNPTEEDIAYFIESASLYLSLVVDMFAFCGIMDKPEDVLAFCRTCPDFYRKYKWTKEQRAEFEHIWTNIFMKCLDMEKYDAYHELECWNALGTAFDLAERSGEYYQEYQKLVEDLCYPAVEDDEDDKNE